MLVMAIHIQLSDAFAVTFALHRSAELLTNFFNIMNRLDHHLRVGGIRSDDREIPKPDKAQEQRLLHRIILHPIELQLIQTTIQHTAANA